VSHPCPKCGKALTRNGCTPAGRTRWVCRSRAGGDSYCYSSTSPGAVPRTQAGRTAPPARRRLQKGKRRFIITAAQNATPVHEKFLKSLEVACEHLNADLLVIPLRYKNPTSRWTASQANEETWAPEVVPYLFGQRKKLSANLSVLGNVKTQPTASSPLTGFDAMTHGESTIVGHTKLQLRTVATPQSRLPKILTTTGACTLPNYTDSKAGAIGAFHHTLGAALAEVDGKTFHLRQINADNQTGEFIDLQTLYRPDGVYVAPRAKALIMGDTHVDFADPAVIDATFGARGMVERLDPETLVWHDLLDGYSVNPHHAGNVFNAIAKLPNSRSSLKDEVQRAIEFVVKHTSSDRESVVVPSNHDNFFARWILSTDWRTAPGNAEFYLETALAMVRSVKLGDGGTEYADPFIHWGRRLAPGVRFLERDESLLIANTELGMHGDRGPNGARGSAKNLRRIGVKSIIGHSHSPAIEEGCYQVGTSTRLKLEYNAGPSGWMNSHAVIYANGKRSLLHIIDGKWRLE